MILIVQETLLTTLERFTPVRWKEVRHDSTVTWLAYWNDPINEKESKYVFLAASSALKGQSDKEKYEKARKLKQYIHDIRKTYTRDFENKDMQKRQIAVATYLIDRLALRAGNEKVFFFVLFFFPSFFFNSLVSHSICFLF